MSVLDNELRGEAILRPFSGGSNLSYVQPVTPTFDLHNNLNDNQSQNPDDDIYGVINLKYYYYINIYS